MPENDLSRSLERLTVKPDDESVTTVASYIESRMEEAGVGIGDITKINIAVDELYSNVVHYSGAEQAEIVCGITEDTVTVVMRDNGTPYNPLSAGEPDITTDPADREIGGLGIFLTKKLMSDVQYSYADGWNEIRMKLDRTASGQDEDFGLFL